MISFFPVNKLMSNWVILLLGLLSFACAPPPAKSPADWRYYDPSTGEVNIGRGRGKGKSINAKELARQYLEACEGRSGPACHRLGTLHIGGIGVARNENRAKELFK